MMVWESYTKTSLHGFMPQPGTTIRHMPNSGPSPEIVCRNSREGEKGVSLSVGEHILLAREHILSVCVCVFVCDERREREK